VVLFQPRIGFSVYLANQVTVPDNGNLSISNWTMSNASYPGFYDAGTFNNSTGLYTVPVDAIYLVGLYMQATFGPVINDTVVTFACFTDVSGARALLSQSSALVPAGQTVQAVLAASTAYSLGAGSTVDLVCGATGGAVLVQNGPDTRFFIERIAT
jgi:hypothetical protein